MQRSCTSEALAEVFGHKPLKELNLALHSAVEVSSACLPGIWLCGLDSTFMLFECITCALYSIL